MMYKALSRIKWRLSSKNSFKPNKEDINALNEVIRWVNNQKKETINKNKLYSKLFITFYNDVITANETTVLDDLAQKQISRLLTTKLSLFYKAFHKQLHDNLRCAIMENKETNKLTESEINQILTEKYSLFEVENVLNDMISESINKFNEYD